MRNFIIEFLLLSIILLLLGCESGAGTIQTEDTGVAMLVDEMGQPVVNASVRVFKYRDSTGIYEDSIATDERGQYKFNQKLAAGRYTIWAETDTSVLYREDLIITPDSLFQDQDTLKLSRNIVVPVKVQPNHDPQTVEVQIWGTPIRHNVTESGHLLLNKIANGTYFTRLTTTLDGYTPTNDTIEIDESSVDDSLHLPDTLSDTLKLIYTGIPVVSGFTHTYDTLNTTVNLTWDQTAFKNIQAYVIERKLMSETLWPTAPLAHVYVSELSHPITYSDVVSVGEAGAMYHYRIRILDNSSNLGVPLGVIDVDAPAASSASTIITASSMQKAKAIVGNRASINDIMSFSVNFSNPSRKLTKIDWFEGTTLLKTTPLTDLIISDSFEKSWPNIGSKSLTVQITDDAGYVWKKVIPVSIVEDKPVISFVDTTINLNVLDTLTAVVSDEFGEIVSYQWDWGNDGTIDATTPQFVMTQTEIEGGVPCKVTVTDDDGNVGEFVSGVTSQLVWEKVGELPEGILRYRLFTYKGRLAGVDENDCIWSSQDGKFWEKNNDIFPEGALTNVRHLKCINFENAYYLLVTKELDELYTSETVLYKYVSDAKRWDICKNGVVDNYDPLCFMVPNISIHNNQMFLVSSDFNAGIEVSVDGETWEKSEVQLNSIDLWSKNRFYLVLSEEIIQCKRDGFEFEYTIWEKNEIVNEFIIKPEIQDSFASVWMYNYRNNILHYYNNSFYYLDFAQQKHYKVYSTINVGNNLRTFGNENFRYCVDDNSIHQLK